MMLCLAPVDMLSLVFLSELSERIWGLVPCLQCGALHDSVGKSVRWFGRCECEMSAFEDKCAAYV